MYEQNFISPRAWYYSATLCTTFAWFRSTESTGQLKCDGTRAKKKNKFRFSAKRTSPFQSAGASVQSTTGSRVVRISGSNAGYTMFRGSVKGTGYPLHSPVSPSLPLPCLTVCHHISTGVLTKLSRNGIWRNAKRFVPAEPRGVTLKSHDSSVLTSTKVTFTLAWPENCSCNFRISIRNVSDV